MGSIILSVLTPAVPKRLLQVAQLCEELQKQIADFPVEHLVFIDNKKRTVGEKRDALLRMARGKYVAFVDDDDWVDESYVFSILNRTEENPDVITFQQQATVNGVTKTVEFKLGNPNDNFDAVEVGMVRRNAWHVCAWRRDWAIQSNFPAVNYGEDWGWAKKLCEVKGLKEAHIPKVLHHYRHDLKTTEAPPGA